MRKALFIIFLIFISGCGQFMDEEISVHPAMCDGTRKMEIGFFDILNGKVCDGNLIPLNRTTYRVSRARQEVIYWLPDIDNLPSRLTDCAVKDAKNFRCDYSDRSGGIIISNGKPVELGPYIFYISWWEWHWLQWGKQLKAPLIVIVTIVSVIALIITLLKDYKEKRAEKKRTK